MLKGKRKLAYDEVDFASSDVLGKLKYIPKELLETIDIPNKIQLTSKDDESFSFTKFPDNHDGNDYFWNRCIGVELDRNCLTDKWHLSAKEIPMWGGYIPGIGYYNVKHIPMWGHYNV